MHGSGHQERNVQLAVRHLGKPQLIAAQVSEHGDDLKQARRAYETIVGEHHDQLSEQGVVGLPKRETFSKEVARKLLNLHAAVLLERRLHDVKKNK